MFNIPLINPNINQVESQFRYRSGGLTLWS